MSLGDAEESELHFVVGLLVGWDMQSFDAWLDDPAEWVGRERSRQQLIEAREEAREPVRDAVQQWNRSKSLEVQWACREALVQHVRVLMMAAKLETMYRAGFELELEQGAGIAQKSTAGKGNKGRRHPLRDRITAFMRRERQAGRQLPQILDNWLCGPEGGLELIRLPGTKPVYKVLDANGDELPRVYTFKTLERMFTDANPATPRERR